LARVKYFYFTKFHIKRVATSTFEQSGSALFDASLLKFVLFEMYNYLTNFRPVLLCAPLQLGALYSRLLRLRVSPTLGTCNKPEIWILEGRVVSPTFVMHSYLFS